MEPHKNNWCGGNYDDWLEVLLTDKCNGNCSWCIEKNGYHPKERAEWLDLATKIIKSGKKNAILLGGEPTLFPDLYKLVRVVHDAGILVYITTNGSKLKGKNFTQYLGPIGGINISIHHFDLNKNKEITGILLNRENLKEAIKDIRETWAASIRLNCNMIAGYIDTEDKAIQYVKWAKELRATSVRFAELKNDKNEFVNIAKAFNYKYGLNDDPYVLGCCQRANIDGLPIEFRQMCGLQTPCRKKPANASNRVKRVLYYDGNFYNGWQTVENKMENTTLNLLEALAELIKNQKEIKDRLDKLENAASNKQIPTYINTCGY